MKIEICDISYQMYIIPFVKITHDRSLNEDYEIIFGWLSIEIIISW